jgi:anti-anti-sigma regulatory factor
MTMTAGWQKIDPNDVAQSLADAREKLDGAENEMVLDFCDVERVDPAGLRGLEDLADVAAEKSAKVALRGVNVGVYKVLKLARLSGRFRIEN